MPIPPDSAIKRAILASVTVSILAETTGKLSLILRENCASVLTSFREKTPLLWGSKSTSSKVYPSRMPRVIIHQELFPFQSPRALEHKGAVSFFKLFYLALQLFF